METMRVIQTAVLSFKASLQTIQFDCREIQYGIPNARSSLPHEFV